MLTIVNERSIGEKGNCTLNKVGDHTWEFFNYDINHFYENNAICFEVVDPTPTYYMFLSFEIYHIEAPFDYVAAQSVADLRTIELRAPDVYVFSDTGLLLEFSSDGTVAFPGFLLKIQEYGIFFLLILLSVNISPFILIVICILKFSSLILNFKIKFFIGIETVLVVTTVL